MRIAFYISSLSGGGAERVLCTLANQLSRENNEVHVVSLEKRKQFYQLDKEVKLHRINNTSKNRIKETINDICFIKKCVKNIKADVSVSFLMRCNLLLLLANLFNKQKVIVCDRNNPLKEHSEKVFKISNLIYARANLIVVQTNQIKTFYDKKLQYKITVQENPIDSVALHNQLEGKDMLKENTVISIGRLEQQKDFVTLIKAYSKVCKDYTDWKLKIFGVGEMQEQLNKLIIDLGCEDKILLCGHTHTPFYELSKSKVFVLSTKYEGFPNVLCEAMEAGLPCIASDCVSGPRELIQNNENGWLFEIANVDELETLLRMCMSNDMSEVGAKAKKSVERLHLDSNLKSWKDMFEKVLQNEK